MKMSDFSNNSHLFLKSMKKKFKVLKDNAQTSNNCCHLFLDVLAMVPNSVFNEDIQRIVDGIELGTCFTVLTPFLRVVLLTRSTIRHFQLQETSLFHGTSVKDSRH